MVIYVSKLEFDKINNYAQKNTTWTKDEVISTPYIYKDKKKMEEAIKRADHKYRSEPDATTFSGVWYSVATLKPLERSLSKKEINFLIKKTKYQYEEVDDLWNEESF